MYSIKQYAMGWAPLSPLTNDLFGFVGDSFGLNSTNSTYKL